MSVEVSDVATPSFSALIGGRTVAFPSIEEKLEALEDAWDDERPGSSIAKYDSFAYQQIVGMGAAVVPLLMDRLRAGEGQWVYALTCITGVQAHSDDMIGDADRIIDAWIEWYSLGGNAHGRVTA